jgi:hypothetical protein
MKRAFVTNTIKVYLIMIASARESPALDSEILTSPAPGTLNVA